jgi:ectoine hydroxylase-related dioxygenase (phytanoyl-CoA dioxygenase family)
MSERVPIHLKDLSQFTQRRMKKHGFFIQKKFLKLDCANDIVRQIQNLNLFDKTDLKNKLWHNIFNENKFATKSKGRTTLPLRSLKQIDARMNDQKYEELIKLVEELAQEIVKQCNKQSELTNGEETCQIPVDDFKAAFLETFDEFTKPQVLHTDVDFSTGAKSPANKRVALVALQDGTKIRVVKGSHNFEDITSFVYDGVNHTSEQIIVLNAGDIIVFHPNLIHSGWTAEKNNVRIHIYIGMKDDIPDDLFNVDTYIAPLEAVQHCNGSGKLSDLADTRVFVKERVHANKVAWTNNLPNRVKKGTLKSPKAVKSKTNKLVTKCDKVSRSVSSHAKIYKDGVFKKKTDERVRKELTTISESSLKTGRQLRSLD